MTLSEPTIALVAGEASGDQLGAALVEELRERFPDARFVGIAGDGMKAAGVEAWWDTSELSVMGLFEVLSHLPRLLRLRRALSRRLLETRPDVFIGIDAPDFNLGLEIKLRRAGIRTVHYVSPTVWAWREKRVRKIARAADLVLCLFPFEPRFYREHQVAAVYVGHPLADQIDPGLDRSIARSQLGTEPRAPTVAILPGSRRSEVARLAEPMIEAARILSSRRTGLRFVAAMANEGVAELFRAEMQRLGFADIAIVLRDPRRVIAAADVVLCASGTATLEVMLVNRPLVMTYIVAPSTYRIGKALGLVKLDWFSLPNILAGKPLVPELIQDQATGGNLADAAERWLDDPQSVETLTRHFRELGRELRCNAAARAAGEVAAQLESRKK
ncbi:MAG: lipid-A-disaccharide synthase [Xanthomonadales bacterium]|jgi:lipid-A-disaccharide synthase|nr:lipid-A-disaccharide synthase [Xanthomonadales bacterium]